MTTENQTSKFDENIGIHFAGRGQLEKIENLELSQVEADVQPPPPKHLLGEWFATAICGNDITSSCLYVSALAIAVSGIYAPLSLILVSLTLYLFRKIYSEVGSALPMNGGTYTLLLNTTSKKIAAAGACLTILSYIATAVISASEAIHYLKPIIPAIPTGISTVLLLFFFAVLTIFGVSESARVALGIFIIHILTISLLIIFGSWNFISNFSSTWTNLAQSLPADPWYYALLKGYFVALLGISGFESSANYIEEQGPGVFEKTLKNMWVAVTIINPVICILALGVLPMTTILADKTNLLARLGTDSSSSWFGYWIGINAFLVLSGAVLTSFVGVTGLVKRMSLDRCLPFFLLEENKFRKTNHWIILGFFAVCVSIYVMTAGDIDSLAGVYTLSFLSVMFLFAIGNALLKEKRAKLPRSSRASWEAVLVGAVLVLIGLVGNFYLNIEGAKIFMIYYMVTISIVLFLMLRTSILKFIFNAIQHSVGLLPLTKQTIGRTLTRWVDNISSVQTVYFTKGDNLATLNRAAQYVLLNEQCKNIKFVHFYSSEENIPKTLGNQIKVIDEIYPNLRIDLLLVKGIFSPELVNTLSRRFGIKKNQMFIGTPGNAFPHKIESLDGVRVII